MTGHLSTTLIVFIALSWGSQAHLDAQTASTSKPLVKMVWSDDETDTSGRVSEDGR
jgi:hypothetical protein